MTVDTRNGVIAILAVGALVAVIIISLIGIIALALTHDGQLSGEAMDIFKTILLSSAFGGTLLGVTERVTSTITAGKAISAGASVQGSPVSVTQSASSEPTSSPAGLSATSLPDGVGM